MESKQEAPEFTAPFGPRVDFDALSPDDIVAIQVIADAWDFHDETDRLNGTPWEFLEGKNLSPLTEQLDAYYNFLLRENPGRFKAIVTAGANSRSREERHCITWYGFIFRLTKVNHDAGLEIWDHLIRDIEPSIRDEMINWMELHMSPPDLPQDWDVPPGGLWGLYALDFIDEAQLLDQFGLTRAEVRGLYESYAYAQNGQYLHDVGRVALDKLITTLEPGKSTNDS
jgi:hypothetical protein